MRLVTETRSQQLVPSSVMGMLIFVVVEAMLFAGLISAFTIIRSSALVWPPLDQPRLPLEETALMAKPRVEFYSDASGEVRWRFKAANGRVVATSGEPAENITGSDGDLEQE